MSTKMPHCAVNYIIMSSSQMCFYCMMRSLDIFEHGVVAYTCPPRCDKLSTALGGGGGNVQKYQGDKFK